ncbi:hypothetical protein [Ancylobacter defluvii]|nr:hypothetical protein [Ancylobacter defluvii]MBS7590387.1 hypothetical protein [Ancylobacter defluvii]
MLWATTRNNLGNAFQTIGAPHDDAEALRGAATAYRLSLEERKANRAPHNHVQTEQSLAVMLFNLVELEQNLAIAEEALGHAIEGRAAAEQLRDLRLQQEKTSPARESGR